MDTLSNIPTEETSTPERESNSPEKMPPSLTRGRTAKHLKTLSSGLKVWEVSGGQPSITLYPVQKDASKGTTPEPQAQEENEVEFRRPPKGWTQEEAIRKNLPVFGPNPTKS